MREQLKRFGKYEVIEELGRGSFGPVYRAVDTTLNQPVALKISHPSGDPNWLQRLQYEMRTVARLTHPNIARICDIGEAEGSCYIAMEYIPGRSLRSLMSDKGPLSPGRTIAIMEQVADALDYAHERRVVHGDVHPGNIIVGLGDFVALIDFESWLLTRDLSVAPYHSPEVRRGERPKPPCDIYSLGALAYEMLIAEWSWEASVAILSGSPRLVPWLQADIGQVIFRAMARDPSQRYGTATGFIQELARLLPGEVEPRHEMILIPAGDFIMGEDEAQRRVVLDEFYMAKYPVTNAGYRAFTQARGYSQSEYWSPEGWKWIQHEQVVEPLYWRHEDFNQPNQPVVGVSYYEAEAYCRWAGKRLPNELGWEKAARGANARPYPWGDEWEEGRCNSKTAGFGTTTPVDRFPQGVSPYGVMDMSGNVWEWTSSQRKTEHRDIVLRGGSWLDDPGFLRCTFRTWALSDYRTMSTGFRCAKDAQ